MQQNGSLHELLSLADGIKSAFVRCSSAVLSDGFYPVDSEEFRKHYKTVSY
jgi:hypothetical protein